jgi:hypothetical protein
VSWTQTAIWWRSGWVREVGRSWRGAVELSVLPDPGPPGTASGTASEAAAGAGAEHAPVLALAYPALVGTPRVGDRVLLNVGALALSLGTGGYALVVALPDRLPADPTDGYGHLMKARYTPLQTAVAGVDEPGSPHHQALAEADDLAGLPVVTADLHSALPAILAGVHADAPVARVAYVMTDGGALPAWFSRTLDALAGTLAGVVTVGQAFGGDLEAASLHTGLLAARHVLDSDVAIVTQGPGNLGTGTRWGFSGVAVGEAVNATAALAGRPVGALRLSAADPRPRHRGVSHHSLTAYGRVALAPADLVLPDRLPPGTAELVGAAVSELAGRHRLVSVPTGGLVEALRASPARLSSMGRGLADDPVYFLANAAAGRHAAGLIRQR